MEELIRKFKEYLEVSNYSPRTIETYLLYILKLKGIDDKSIEEYLSETKNYSPASRVVMLSALKLFLSINNIETSVKLPKIRVPDNLRDYKLIPPEIIYAIDYDNIRDEAVVKTFFFQGIRRSELLNLRWKDIDFVNNEIIVYRKRGKKQVLPLHKEVRRVLKELMKSEYYHPPKVFPISASTAWRIVKKYTGKYPHYLRACFAIMVGQKNLPVAQQLLGHSRIETTMRYVRIHLEQMKEVMQEI